MPITPTTCPLDCPDACGVLVESDERGRFVRLRGDPAHGFSQGVLCAKTSWYGDLIASPHRLLAPLVRDGAKPGGRLRVASWDEAIGRIVERVKPLRGDSILAAWYAGSMGRIARKFPLRMMHALGATLVDDGLCDNTSTVGYQAVLGRVIGFDLERAEECDLVLLWGCDMTRTVQHLQPAVQRLAKRGVPVVAIDIYRTDTIRALERWGGSGVVIRPGSDAALALALARLAFERGFADREFLASQCLGAERFELHLRSQGSGAELAGAQAATGLESAAIVHLADLLGNSRNPLLKTGVGFARRRNGAMSMRAVCSLAAVLGRVHNVHYESSDTFQLSEVAIERPDLRPAAAPLREIRHVQLGRELETGRYRALFVWGHNPAVMCPDSSRVRSGMARADVFVVVHEQFLTESAELADVVLPATMFPEHADVYRSYGHRRLRYARQASRPPEGPRNNVEAFSAIARALGLPRETWNVTAEGLCEEFLRASSERLDATDLDRLRRGTALKLEPPAASGWGTPSGKIELYSESCAASGQPPMATFVPDDACGERGRFWLVCAPSRFTHNSTFSHSPRHVARTGPPTCHMNPVDASELGLAAGEQVTLENSRGQVSLLLATTNDLPRGLVRVDGVPRAVDVPERIGINVLVSPELSDMGAGNVLYSTRVDVRSARARPT